LLLAGVAAAGDATSQPAGSETHILVEISTAFIIGSLLMLTRSVGKSLIILLPVIAGIVAMLVMLSMSMSVVTMVAAIIVLALTSDYGAFALYACEGNETVLGQGMASVNLSFVTTLVGTGALIFARHPALYMVGVSLTSGLAAGWLTAFFVIPGIYAFRNRRVMTEGA
jgi:predicted exporter